jgi:hypothetical protein
MHVMPQDPLTRIHEVATNLGRLGDELGGSLGPEAQRVLAHWRKELLEALEALERLSGPKRDEDAGQGARDDAR